MTDEVKDKEKSIPENQVKNELNAIQENQEELPAKLLKFPCFFPMKVVGLAEPGYADEIVKIIQKYVPHFIADEVNMKPSSQGKYVSLGFAFTADSQDQLDNLYQELVDHPKTKFVI